jgi:hypothetical protein
VHTANGVMEERRGEQSRGSGRNANARREARFSGTARAGARSLWWLGRRRGGSGAL